ncbi:hypothetical protein [Hymenobacter nivis]|uniref:hypothetical protein n=1 Tax=Hymenobacter nivis TaxID=1850093 RepID=UPI0013A56A3C|nr:hypothetical protein [Hymenobacter nivis]
MITALKGLAAAAWAGALITCCGAPAWVGALNQRFPFATAAALLAAADEVWYSLAETD